MRLRRQAPHQIGFNAGRPGRPRGARAAHGLCHDERGPRGSRSRPGRFEGPGRAQAAGRPASQARETRLNYYSSPICVRLVYSPSNACPHPAGACIVLPRAAPRSAAARTPRTGYCGRRRRSDRPFRTGFIRWLEEEEILSQAPVFHEFLESICFQTYKVLIWTESSILAQDERWRRA